MGQVGTPGISLIDVSHNEAGTSQKQSAAGTTQVTFAVILPDKTKQDQIARDLFRQARNGALATFLRQDHRQAPTRQYPIAIQNAIPNIHADPNANHLIISDMDSNTISQSSTQAASHSQTTLAQSQTSPNNLDST